MKRFLASLLVVLGLSALLWGCDAQNLPTAVVATPTLEAVAPTAPPATSTPEPHSPTPTLAAPTPVPTEIPTLTPTEEPSPTEVVEPTDSPTAVQATAAATNSAPPSPRATRTATRTPPSAGQRPATLTPMPESTQVGGIQPTPVASGPPTGAWSQVVKVAPGKKRIALTFDAGASGETWPQIMATLKERGLHITMFFTGKFAEQYPDAIKQALADGHELGNHTYSHLDSRDLTDQQLIGELSRTENIIQNLTGATTKPYWRPPFGAYNNHVLQVAVSQGYRSIYWTLDSLDSVGQPKTPDFIFNRVTHPPAGINLDGAIVLQHFGSQSSADALPRELDALKAMGLQVGTVSQLLSP